MKPGHRSRRIDTVRTKLDPDELRRASRLARAILPRGKLGASLRRLPRDHLIVDAFILVGCAAAKAFRSKWHPLFLRAVAIVLSDARQDEAVRRALRGWDAFEEMDGRRRARVKLALALDLREEFDGERRRAGRRSPPR